MKTIQSFTKVDRLTKWTTTSEAYTTDGGQVWCWTSNDAVIEVKTCSEYGIPCDPAAQQAAHDQYVDGVLAQYRAAMANYRPSAEEQYEMRAAFGAGKTVVDVITGQKYQL